MKLKKNIESGKLQEYCAALGEKRQAATRRPLKEVRAFFFAQDCSDGGRRQKRERGKREREGG